MDLNMNYDMNDMNDMNLDHTTFRSSFRTCNKLI